MAQAKKKKAKKKTAAKKKPPASSASAASAASGGAAAAIALRSAGFDAQGLDWAPSALDDRARVIEVLTYKAQQLDAWAQLLINELSMEMDPATLFRWEAVYGEAVTERDLCRARVQALLAGGPFRRPSPDQEHQLLEAIRKVGRAAAQNAALRDLIGAFANVADAYSAFSTRPL